VVVDQECRALVAQAGAGGLVHADQAVGAQPTGRHAQTAAEVGHQDLAAEQAVGDVVAEQHAVGAHRVGMEEAVEPRHPFHMGQGQAERGGKLAQDVARQPAVRGLQLAQDLHQRMGFATPVGERGRQGSDWIGRVWRVGVHGDVIPKRRASLSV
jgi:hypothetical protein